MNELKELQINYGQASVIKQDLFLMANQIPFGVLDILMDSLPCSNNEEAFTKHVFKDSIDSFIVKILFFNKNNNNNDNMYC